MTLSAATGQGFELSRIRAGRARPGLRPQHLAAIRAAAMACEARVGGVFEGSPDLRFEPRSVAAGRFRFEIGTAGASSLVLQTVLPALATAGEESSVEVVGGTHVPLSPSFHYLERHWREVLGRLGLWTTLRLLRAGFLPKGGGEAHAEVRPWERPASLGIEERGELLALRGVSGAVRLRGGVAERQRDAARQRLWEERRYEPAIEVVDPGADSPGSFLILEAVFEHGRAAFSALGQRGVRAEQLGDRLARRLLGWLDGKGAVDPWLADQLAVPLAVARGGGRISTSEVTSHLETVAAVVRSFGVAARVEGARGGTGVLEVAAC